MGTISMLSLDNAAVVAHSLICPHMEQRHAPASSSLGIRGNPPRIRGVSRVILGKGSMSKRTCAVETHVAQGQLYIEGRLCELYGGGR